MTTVNRLAPGVAALMICALVTAQPAFAATDIAGVLGSILAMMTGPIAKGVCLLAICGVGFAFIGNMVDMRQVFFLIIGIGIIFGVPQIASQLGIA